MFRFINLLLVVFLLAAAASCSNHPPEEGVGNGVNINGIDIDNSTNYRYLFREEIQKEKMKNHITDEEYFKK